MSSAFFAYSLPYKATGRRFEVSGPALLRCWLGTGYLDAVPAAALMNASPIGEPHPVTLSQPGVTVSDESVPKLIAMFSPATTVQFASRYVCWLKSSPENRSFDEYAVLPLASKMVPARLVELPCGTTSVTVPKGNFEITRAA